VGAYLNGIGGVLWSRIIINGIFGILLILFVSHIFVKNKKEYLTLQEKREANIYAVQYMLTNGLWAVFMLNDTFLLGIFSNNAEIVAEYKVAYVMPGNISIFATAIGVFTGPIFTKNEKNIKWIQENYKKVFITSGLIVGMVALALFIFAEPLVVFMYGTGYKNIVPLMRVLLVAAFFNSGIRYTSANLLASMGQIKYNMSISIVGMVLQIVLDIWLIGKFKAMGVAISSCIVYAFMAISLFIIFVNRYYRSYE